jgi:hypothetical protein
MMESVTLTKVHCKQMWKCHSEPPIELMYANKMFLKC